MNIQEKTEAVWPTMAYPQIPSQKIITIYNKRMKQITSESACEYSTIGLENAYKEVEKKIQRQCQGVLLQEKVFSKEVIGVTLRAIEIFWRLDLRKGYNDASYKEIALRIARQLSNGEPINLVQFTCPQREPLRMLESTTPEEVMRLDPYGNNLTPNIATLMRYELLFADAGIPIAITVLIGDTDLWYIESREGQDTMYGQDFLAKLIPRFRLYKEALVQEVETLYGGPLENISIKSFWEEEESLRRQGGTNFEIVFREGQAYAKDWVKNQDPGNSIKSTLRTLLCLGMEAYLRGERKTDLCDVQTEMRLQDCVERKFAEYGAQSILLEEIAPNSILLQNEAQVVQKEAMYNNLRKVKQLARLPIMYPYFTDL